MLAAIYFLQTHLEPIDLDLNCTEQRVKQPNFDVSLLKLVGKLLMHTPAQ